MMWSRDMYDTLLMFKQPKAISLLGYVKYRLELEYALEHHYLSVNEDKEIYLTFKGKVFIKLRPILLFNA